MHYYPFGPTREKHEEDFKKEKFRFYTGAILQKWGYGDGGQLGDILNHWEVNFGPIDHQALYNVVAKLVVPKITSHKNIVLYFMHTSHNPVRAETVDGVEVKYSSDDAIKFEPEYVDITGQELMDFRCDDEPS